MSPAELPFAPPRWLTPERVALCAVSLAGAAAATPAVLLALPLVNAVFFGGRLQDDYALGEAPWWLVAALAVSAAIVSAVHARDVVHTLPAKVFARSLGRGAFLGATYPAVVSAVLMIGMLFLGGAGVLPLFLLVCLVVCLAGALVGALFGLLFGAVYAFPLLRIVGARQSPAHDDAEHALVSCGSWLALLGGLLALPPVGTWAAVTASTAALIGLCAAGVGGALGMRRKRWLAAVVAGKVEGFAVVSSETEDPRGLLPFWRRRGRLFGELLVATARREPDPYRSTAGQDGLALLAEEDLRGMERSTRA